MEKVTLYGGPRHGAVLDIPAGHGDVLAFEVLVSNKRGKGKRPCRYTRVHTISRAGTHDFEWSGFTGQMVPLAED